MQGTEHFSRRLTPHHAAGPTRTNPDAGEWVHIYTTPTVPPPITLELSCLHKEHAHTHSQHTHRSSIKKEITKKKLFAPTYVLAVTNSVQKTACRFSNNSLYPSSIKCRLWECKAVVLMTDSSTWALNLSSSSKDSMGLLAAFLMMHSLTGLSV